MMQNQLVISNLKHSNSQKINKSQMLALGTDLIGNILNFLTYEGFSWLFLFNISEEEKTKDLQRRIFLVFPYCYQAFIQRAPAEQGMAALLSTISTFARSPEKQVQNVNQIQHLLQQFRGAYSLCDILQEKKSHPVYWPSFREATWCRTFLRDTGCTMFVNSPAVSADIKEHYNSALLVADKILSSASKKPNSKTPSTTLTTKRL